MKRGNVFGMQVGPTRTSSE